MLDCPAPDTLTFWLNAATTSGITLALAAAIGVVALVVTWRGGVKQRGVWLVAVVSALAAAGGVWAFALARSLNSAFGEIARYYPDYPYDCDWYGHGGPGHIAALARLSQQIALPREHAAEVTAIVALVIVVAQIIAVVRWTRSAGPRVRTLPEGLEVEAL